MSLSMFSFYALFTCAPHITLRKSPAASPCNIRQNNGRSERGTKSVSMSIMNPRREN